MSPRTKLPPACDASAVQFVRVPTTRAMGLIFLLRGGPNHRPDLQVQQGGNCSIYAVKHPERAQALIVQNGNAYEEGLRDFWIPFRAYWKDRSDQNAEPLRKFLTYEATKWQYTNGVRNVEVISPDTWTTDQYLLDRPGNKEIQLQMFYSYGSNPPLYPEWQAYFRKYQPPTLIVWGKNDVIFPAEGAEPYKRDLKNLEFHLLDTGHFALEEDGDLIASYIDSFLDKQVKKPGTAA